MPLDLKITAKGRSTVTSNILTRPSTPIYHVSGKARERNRRAGTIHVIRAKIGIPNSLPPTWRSSTFAAAAKAAPPRRASRLIVGIDFTVRRRRRSHPPGPRPRCGNGR